MYASIAETLESV